MDCSDDKEPIRDTDEREDEDGDVDDAGDEIVI